MGTKIKPIVAKPKAKADITSYLIDVVWSGRLRYNWTSLTDDFSQKMEIDIWHQGRKWNYHADDEESIVARTKQSRPKANRDDMTYFKVQRSINKWLTVYKFIFLSSLALP